VLQFYTISKLQRRHPKLAATWAIALIGVESYAALNDIPAARNARR
jgi:hypothetical protein